MSDNGNMIIKVNLDGSLTPVEPTPGWLEWDGQCNFTVTRNGTFHLEFTAPPSLMFRNFTWLEQGTLTCDLIGPAPSFIITDPVHGKADPAGVFTVDLSDGTVVDPSIANNPPN